MRLSGFHMLLRAVFIRNSDPTDQQLFHECALDMKYPTSASGIIVLLETPAKCGEFFPTLFVKITVFHLVFIFSRIATIFGEHRIMANIP